MNNKFSRPFTPALVGSVGTGEGVYDVREGRVSLHAGQVDIAMSLSWLSHDGNGEMIIRGVPADLAPASYAPMRIGQVQVEGMAYTGSLYAYLNGTGTDISIARVNTDGRASPLELTPSGTIHIRLSYNANA